MLSKVLEYVLEFMYSMLHRVSVECFTEFYIEFQQTVSCRVSVLRSFSGMWHMSFQ